MSDSHSASASVPRLLVGGWQAQRNWYQHPPVQALPDEPGLMYGGSADVPDLAARETRESGRRRARIDQITEGERGDDRGAHAMWAV